ncbi:MAG TPA: hypothetical protein VF307_07980 [Candidatus Nanopelagicaceae bacterium]
MKKINLSKNLRSNLLRAAVASILPIAMMSPAMGADPAPSAPIALSAPAGLPGVPALPFTGTKSAAFTVPATMVALTVTPQQGPEGTPITITGVGLPASATMPMTWSTADGAWLADVQPTSINYMGTKYTKYNVDMATVTTDANGAFTFKTKIPRDFGALHDIYVVKDGTAVAHGGYQLSTTLSISPKSGPIGTPITVTYTGMGASLYIGGVSVLWDNNYAGEATALWTRGTSVFKIRAAGPVGTHYIAATAGIGVQYMNIKQSPVPWGKGSVVSFKVTKDAGAPKASIEYPPSVAPSSALRTTLSDVGVDPNTKAVVTLSQDSGIVGAKVNVNVTGLSTTGDHQLVWATVVGNRVNCTGTCWVYNYLPLGNATPTNGALSQAITVPDHLGGWHVIQVKQGDVIEAQIPFYVKQSIFNYVDKAGKVLSAGIAKADPSPTPELRDGSGVPKSKFKAGEEFTIAMKGVGWTQLDNTMAVTYDNSYIGYGCGFNSNGYMVVHLVATGAPGTHIIDLHPVLYTFQPSFANTPYGGGLPVLSNNSDLPGLALGYQPPAVHFAITITK